MFISVETNGPASNSTAPQFVYVSDVEHQYCAGESHLQGIGVERGGWVQTCISYFFPHLHYGCYLSAMPQEVTYQTINQTDLVAQLLFVQLAGRPARVRHPSRWQGQSRKGIGWESVCRLYLCVGVRVDIECGKTGAIHSIAPRPYQLRYQPRITAHRFVPISQSLLYPYVQ